MFSRKKWDQKSKRNMNVTERKKTDYFIYALMAAVIVQICILVYRIIMITSI